MFCLEPTALPQEQPPTETMEIDPKTPQKTTRKSTDIDQTEYETTTQDRATIVENLFKDSNKQMVDEEKEILPETIDLPMPVPAVDYTRGSPCRLLSHR